MLVARGGRVLYTRAIGMADTEAQVPVTPETTFRIGSITKPFTAAAILKLRDQGVLDLRDPLSRFLPDFPRGDEVTLYQLLTHSSGIYDYTRQPGFAALAAQPIGLSRLIESFAGAPFEFSPGTRYHYANSGYVLLGAVIEKASGRSYSDYLRQTFFEPLGMRHTGVYRNEAPPVEIAHGYSWEAGRVAPAPDWDMSRVAAAGAIYSTVDDLRRWSEAFFGGEVLGPESLRQTLAVGILDGDDPTHPETRGYGLGWEVDALHGLRQIAHGGELPGFGSYLLYYSDTDLTVVVLLNCVPQLPGVHQWALARRIAEMTLGDALPPEPTPATGVRVSAETLAETLAAIAGDYDMRDGTTLKVTSDGGRVFLQVGGGDSFEVFAQSERLFAVRGGEATATFVRDADGRVVKAILRQAGDRIDAPRVDSRLQ